MARISWEHVCRFPSDYDPQAGVAVRPERPFARWGRDVHAEDSGRVAGYCPRDALVPGRGRRKASPPTRELLVASGRLLPPDPRHGGILHGSGRAPRVCPLQPCDKLELERRTVFCRAAALVGPSGLSREYHAGLAWRDRKSTRLNSSHLGI